MSNNNLHKAKKEKNDEFYTLLSDIENELKHYEQHFKGKIVYSNCDSPESNFVKYFTENKERLGIKEFYYTWYNKETGEGDYNSEENIELLKKADIIVTNPPFSLFRDFVSLLTYYNKKFIIIGAMGAITYKDCFKLIKDGCMWLGVEGRLQDFEIPINTFDTTRKDMFIKNQKAFQKLGSVLWFTNLEHDKRNKKLILTKEYNPVDYPKYDNYDAIEVSRVINIPKDYDGVMGVPISFLTKWNPDQFEIVGATISGDVSEKTEGLRTCSTHKHSPFIKKKEKYKRLLIKHKT